MPNLDLTTVTALLVVVLGAAVWTVRLAILARQRRRIDAEPAGSRPRVSLIVPARNEAHNLPALLDSLARLSPAPDEIIVVDDHSDDGTGELARSRGAKVVTPPPLPPGWMGKPWACKTGAEAATGDFLVFTDADTVHGPRSIGRALARMQATGAGLLSVVPTHVARVLWERIQGVFQLLLMIATRAGAADGAATGERRFSIGQYLVFRRDTYERLGGHHAVKNRVAEDLAFARLVGEIGEPFELLFEPGTLRVRMYPEGLRGFIKGWRRNFREGMASAGLGGIAEMVAVIGWLLGLPVFATQAALAGDLAAVGLWAGVYALTSAEIARRQRDHGDFPAWSAPLYPLFAGLFVFISILAVLDRARRAPVRWRGRSIPAASVRDGGQRAS